jgi:hypothetical protein
LKHFSPSRHTSKHQPTSLVLLFPLLLAIAVPALAQGNIFSTQPSPSPNLQGNTLNAVTAISATDAWAVGYQNDNNLNESRTLAMHWDGTAWKTVSSPNPANTPSCQGFNTGNILNSISAVATNDVWAAGFSFDCLTFELKPMAMHWNGTAWKVTTTPKVPFKNNSAFNGILALASDNVYAVGYTPELNGADLTLIEHWNGKAWKVMPSPSIKNHTNILFGISGSSPTDIWTVGARIAPNFPIETLTLHYDGTAWKIVPSPNVLTTGDLNQNVMMSVQAVAPNDVTAVGYVLDENNLRELTMIQHWNGSKWAIVPSPNQSTAAGSFNTLHGVTALSATDMYATGFFVDTASGGQQRTFVVHSDGSTWSAVPTQGSGLAQQLNGIFALPGTQDVWTVGGWSENGTNPEGGLLIVPQTLVLFSPMG